MGYTIKSIKNHCNTTAKFVFFTKRPLGSFYWSCLNHLFYKKYASIFLFTIYKKMSCLTKTQKEKSMNLDGLNLKVKEIN